MSELINRVASANLLTLKLDSLAPESPTLAFDLKDYLWQGLALKEKDFRTSVKTFDWSLAKGKVLCVYCSADAIVAQWAYMLIASAAAPYATEVYVGTPVAYDRQVLAKAARELDLEMYRDQRVVIKGLHRRARTRSAGLRDHHAPPRGGGAVRDVRRAV